MRTRRICIDALNVAYWCGSPPSLRLPLTLVTHLLARKHDAVLYFDASSQHRMIADAEVYARLLLHSRHVVEVPSGRSADRVMLRYATSNGACIVSRDHFRDYRRRYRKLIEDPARLMPGNVANNRLHVPLLDLDVPLSASSEAACDELAGLEESMRAGLQVHGAPLSK